MGWGCHTPNRACGASALYPASEGGEVLRGHGSLGLPCPAVWGRTERGQIQRNPSPCPWLWKRCRNLA